MTPHVWMIRERHRRIAGMQQMICVLAMNDVHLMPAIGQRMRKPVHLDGIATETIRRIERGQVEEIQRPAHELEAFSITSIICRAAVSHVSRQAAARAASLIRRRRSGEESSCL